MNRIRTSFNIIFQSLKLMQLLPKLVFFPVLNFIGMFGILAFFALPLMFETNIFSVVDDFPQVMQQMQEMG